MTDYTSEQIAGETRLKVRDDQARRLLEGIMITLEALKESLRNRRKDDAARG